MPKISVIIPVYNVENYLHSCVDSLLAQTIKDIEFIFIDDASPDNSLSILREYEKAHSDKIKVVHLDKNVRQGGARNVGIKIAKGEYIGFVDSDDFIAPEMFEELFNEIERTNADAVFCKKVEVPDDASIQSIEELKHKKSTTKNFQRFRNKDGTTLTSQIKSDFIVFPIPMTTGLYNKKLIIENNLFFPEKIRYEDNYLFTLLKCYLGKISFVDKNFYFYRQNPNSTIHKKDVTGCYERITIEKNLLEKVKEKGLFRECYSAFEYLYIVRYALNTYMDFLRKSEKPPMKVMVGITKDLKREFPNWAKNKYFLNNFTRKQLFRNKLIIRFPRLYPIIYKLYDGRR